MNEKRWQSTLAWIVAAYLLAFAFLAVFWRPLGLQWDFLVLYDAAHSWRLGLDPYNFSQLEAQGIRAGSLNFTYLPFLAPFFAPFTFLSPSLALGAWFLCKLGLLAIFLYFASRFERIDLRNGGTLLFLALAFNGTIAWDLVCGNISLLQQACFWAGLWMLWQGRNAWFVAAVVFSACFKIYPLALLALLFVLPRRKNFGALCAGIALFAIFIAANRYFMPVEFGRFLEEAKFRVAAESGVLSPSSLALARDLSQTLNSISTLPFLQDGFVVNYLPWCLYLGFVFGLLGYSLFFWLRTEGREVDEKVFLYFCLATYVLVAPRVKSYEFIILLVPALYMIRNAPSEWRYLLAFMICLPHALPVNDLQGLLVTSPFLGPVRKGFRLAYEYWPLLCTGLLWRFLLAKLSKQLR